MTQERVASTRSALVRRAPPRLLTATVARNVPPCTRVPLLRMRARAGRGGRARRADRLGGVRRRTTRRRRAATPDARRTAPAADPRPRGRRATTEPGTRARLRGRRDGRVASRGRTEGRARPARSTPSGAGRDRGLRRAGPRRHRREARQPYYVARHGRERRRQRPRRPDGPALPAINGASTLSRPWRFRSRFTTCPTEPLPDGFKPGRRRQDLPGLPRADRGTLEGVSFRADRGVRPDHVARRVEDAPEPKKPKKRRPTGERTA